MANKTITFRTTIRSNKGTIRGKQYISGRLNSNELIPFIGKEVEITVVEV